MALIRSLILLILIAWKNLVIQMQRYTQYVQNHRFLNNSYCIISQGADENNIFIQQVIYGCHREKAGLECFINNFYGDYAARILRSDKTLFTIFAYLAVYRLDELGFPVFKSYVLSQDPSKMFNFITYLFNSVSYKTFKYPPSSFIEKLFCF